MILGTAGHIDHGKTALVRALTGVDTDRLPEEKRRGITIDLGFAPLTLEGVGVVGVVDVPGHEAFVRTMLAGAAGIDLALLVVAADEGVMPQTREHLAILDVLGIRGGVVALTKCDLVDDDMRALAEEEVRDLVAPTVLRDAPIVAVSAQTGAGLEALTAALTAACQRVPARDATDTFRMPVDRVFTVKGTGTVVTGTVWSGAVTRDTPLIAWPGGALVRVRGIESHGQAVDEGHAGQRVAIALAGVDRDQLSRGAMLVADAGISGPSDRLRADVTLLADAAIALTPRTTVRLHLGTADVGARVVARGGPVRAGEVRPVRLVLDAMVLARAGDRFVLRAASPVMTTIGGGIVTDPTPPFRRVPPFAHANADALTRLRWMVTEAGPHGVSVNDLPSRLGLRADGAPTLLAAASDLVVIEHTVVERARIAQAREVLFAGIDEAHARRPLDRGAPLQALRAKLPLHDVMADHVVRAAFQGGEITLVDGFAARAGWAPKFSADDAAALQRIIEHLDRVGREAPTMEELHPLAGPRTPTLVRLLEREGKVVAVGEQRFVAAAAFAELLRDLRKGTQERRSYSASEIREMFGISRKFAIPLIEGCDRLGVSSRQGEGRVFHWHLPNPAIDRFLDTEAGKT